jgi:hypothetical protein
VGGLRPATLGMPLALGGDRRSRMTTESRTQRLPLIGGALTVATCLTLCLATTAYAQESPAAKAGMSDEGSSERADGKARFGEKGAVELGGSIGLAWTNDAFTLDVSPTVGYFILDRVEVSALLRITYQDQEDDRGDRESVKRGALLFEPSYHLPVREELFVFAGLGMGVGHDDEDFDLEIVPRGGLNVGLGLIGLVTPSVRLPILIDNDGTSAGLGLELGYSAVW